GARRSSISGGSRIFPIKATLRLRGGEFPASQSHRFKHAFVLERRLDVWPFLLCFGGANGFRIGGSALAGIFHCKAACVSLMAQPPVSVKTVGLVLLLQ